MVYKGSELIDISDGAVSMKLVGKAHPGRAIAFLDETYPPGSDTGMDMLSHQGEEAGILVEGRLELTVSGQVYVLESGDSYYFEQQAASFPQSVRCAGAADQRHHRRISNAGSASRSKVRCDKASLGIAGPFVLFQPAWLAGILTAARDTVAAGVSSHNEGVR